MCRIGEAVVAIQIKCGCGKVLKAPDSQAGQKGKCPNCGAILPVPDYVVAEVVEEGPGADTPRSPVAIRCFFCQNNLAQKDAACNVRLKGAHRTIQLARCKDCLLRHKRVAERIEAIMLELLAK